MTKQRVVFSVRCHGEPNEELEDMICSRLSDAVNIPEAGWGILTIGRQYFHNIARCPGHDTPDEDYR